MVSVARRRVGFYRVTGLLLTYLPPSPPFHPSGTASTVTAANAMLRRYFADITERFLSPLNRYVSSLIPPQGLSGGDSAAKIKPFNTDAFLASLKAHGTPLPLRSRSLPTASTVRAGLYLDFLRSPNFSFYLTERIEYYKTRDPVPAASKTRFESK